MRFTVKTYSAATGILLQQIDAVSAEEARRRFESAVCTVFSVEAARQSAKFVGRSETKRFSLTQFSQQLLSLLESGLNLVEAIEALAEKENNPNVESVLRHLLECLYSGYTCSRAMEEVEVFPPFYVATIRASEQSGNLAESLRRYVAYQQQIEGVRKKVVSAMIYPLLLLVAGGLVTVFLLGYVVPKFSRIYEDRATNLPWMSQMLILWGNTMAHHGRVFLVGVMACIVGIWSAAMSTRVRAWIWQRLWSAPVIGERLKLYQLARIFRTLGMLLRGGTPIVAALDLISGLLSASLRLQLAEATKLVREGNSIADALSQAGLTTPVSNRMLRVGEKSGNMGEMMERIAVFYDDEIAQWIDVFTKVFEPALMTLIGFMVGGIVILMYLPIFELAGNLQ